MKNRDPLYPIQRPKKDRKRINAVELAQMLKHYQELGNNQEFINDCKTFDHINSATEVGDRRTSEFAVNFYIKWNAYPIPTFCVNDHIFWETLERFF